MEGVNATHACKKSRGHNNPLFDVRAREYAAGFGLPMTAGSDIHGTDLLFGGIACADKLCDVHDYVRLMKSVRGVPAEAYPYKLLDGNESC